MAIHAPVGKGRRPSPEETHPAHASAPATRAALSTPMIGARVAPTSITISEITSPNNTPAPIGVAPVNSYSPKISAPMQHATAALAIPKIGLSFKAVEGARLDWTTPVGDYAAARG